MRVTLHPGVEQDLLDAAEFYQREGSPMVAARFIDEFRRIVGLLQVNPGLGAPLPAGRRAMTMQVFPFALVYRQMDDGIRILLVRHTRRHPNVGRSRR